MKLASWNVNSVRARLDLALAWLEESKPDIACLQELKCEGGVFPYEAFEEAGYASAVLGQKAYNGVAILARGGVEDVERGLPGMEGDEQARYIEAFAKGADGEGMRVGCLYAPNGNPLGTEKFDYKLRWLDGFLEHARGRLEWEEPFVLAGDYNIIPEEEDAYDSSKWTKDAVFAPEARERFRILKTEGWWDAHRVMAEGEEEGYTFWGYRGGSWAKGEGIRIDHLALSPQAADGLRGCGVDRYTRGWERPSDHAPVWASFEFGEAL